MAKLSMADTLGAVADQFTIADVVLFLSGLLPADEAARLAALIVMTAAREVPDSSNAAYAFCFALASNGASGEFVRELATAATACAGRCRS